MFVCFLAETFTMLHYVKIHTKLTIYPINGPFFTYVPLNIQRPHFAFVIAPDVGRGLQRGRGVRLDTD